MLQSAVAHNLVFTLRPYGHTFDVVPASLHYTIKSSSGHLRVGSGGVVETYRCGDEMSSEHRDITDTYTRVLEQAILHLRMRIRYGEDVSSDEVHDLMDSLHNIPHMIRNCGGWHVPENIDADLAMYDEKWLDRDDGGTRRPLVKLLNDIRNGEHDGRP